MSESQKPPLWILVGPTAVGKTEISCRVAEWLNGEIISADSMQVYRGMDIGTSKPSWEIRAEIPHHLIDVTEPTELFDVVQYRQLALQAISEILRCRKNPIVVGGSGLYVRVLLKGIFSGPTANNELRQELYQEAAVAGTAALHQRLGQIDPFTAQTTHPNDVRRIIRALEVYDQCQKPLSLLKADRQSLKEQYDVRIVGLNRHRADLYERINRRVDQMFAQGLIQECESLNLLGLSQTASQALGYREVFSYLSGKISLEECIHLVKRNTRRYAKRQMTWFRHEEGVSWIGVDFHVSIEVIAREVVRQFIA